MLTLRTYQNDGVNDIRISIKNGFKSILYTLPTGGGKTVVFSYIANQTVRNGKRVLILVHRVELLRQTSAALLKSSVDHGLINPKFTPNLSAAAQVASVQTLVNRLDKILPPDVIIIDEAHHAKAGSWRKVLNYFPDALILGVTATPVRGDGTGLDDVFETLVLGPQIANLIDMGYLVKPIVYAPPEKIDFTEVKIVRGDYDKKQVAEVMDKPKIIGSAVAHYIKICPGVPAVAFCVSINHAEHVAEEFRQAGFRAYSVDGGMDDDTRKRILDGLGNGSVDVVTSCDLISEGTDIPAIECAIFLRPTHSLGLYIQQGGRALRLAEGKSNAYILDHVGNVMRHGFLDDVRFWTLSGRKKGDRKKTDSEETIRVQQCESCFAVHEPAQICPYCGNENKKKFVEPKQIEGELVLLNQTLRAEKMAESARRVQEVAAARTIEDLKKIEKEKGYTKGWAERLVKSRSTIKGQAFFVTPKTRTTPKAVKLHRCDVCFLNIEKGTVYDNSISQKDGNDYVWKSHTDCSELIETVFSQDHEKEITKNEFEEMVRSRFESLKKKQGVTEFVFPSFIDQLEAVKEFYLEII